MQPVYKSSYPEGAPASEVYADGIQGAYETTFARSTIETVFGGVWVENERSRAPYTDAWTLKDKGITLYASQTLNHCTVEISGQGCERLLAIGAMADVLKAIHDRTTRIDIACDIETETEPEDFVSETSHERMRSSGTQKSESGTTCYIGSRTSDRYARVYRYRKPHPRHKLLRVEHVFRKEYAKAVALQLMSSDESSVAAACGMAFGWAHRDWQVVLDKLEPITIVAPERNMGKTVFWMVDTVAPCFRKLVREGVIKEPEEFIKRYFMPE